MQQSDIEKQILDFWEKDRTFEKSVQRKAPKGEYVFYDGPPFATGTPHYGHIVASLMKDMVPRFWTMRGFRVERRWGWDCHGLPIENIVEQEHGFKHKKDILAYGVDKFNEDARSKVLTYVSEWKKVITRLGRWVDFDNDYKTMDLEFMESVWWVFKELHDKGLLYEAYRSMHICPRCETTLAQSEVAQGYKEVTDLSVIAKFELVDEPGTFLLAWTTTPWTLPGNMALAVGEDIEYAAVEFEGSKYIAAKDRIADVFAEKEHGAVSKVSASSLIGKSYKPLFPYYDNNALSNRENAFKVYAGDFVNTEEGTGIVHIAPAFGNDDYELSKKENIPFVQHVHMDGTFKSEVKDFAGAFVKHQDKANTQDHPESKDAESADIKIIKYLAKQGTLFSKKKYNHEYPHCWRCDSPLLNYATSSWFVAVEKIKKDLLKNAEKIEWSPKHIKEGRFGQWLAGSRDWSISRQRFWGSVLPVWKCENSETHIRVIGSVSELEKLSGKTVTDLHKHFIDPITFKCKECGGTMKRIPDVLDCWFEAGSMPYGQQHYPFENEKKFKENFPAAFIAEGVDQTRAWFYYLHVLATALKKKPAFKHVVVNGIVLAEDGKKMSKRLKNYPDPSDMFEKYGADAVRYYLATSPVLSAEDFNFSEKGVENTVKKVLLIVHNVLSLYKMYAPRHAELVSASDSKNRSRNKFGMTKGHVLDEWIVAKTNQLIKETTHAYEAYDLNKATRPIAEYVNELSTWYVRRSRDRIKDRDKSALETLKWSLEQLSLVMAPVMPFTSEHVWQELGHGESVHLAAWPTAGTIDESALSDMDKARRIVEQGLASRAHAGIKIRQPLASAAVSGEKLATRYSEIIGNELNVKNVTYHTAGELGVSLDTGITPELKTEGNLRELVRAINAMRKNKGLTPGDNITLTYHTSSAELKKVFDEYAGELKKSVIASKLVEEKNEGEQADINGEKINITF